MPNRVWMAGLLVALSRSAHAQAVPPLAAVAPLIPFVERSFTDQHTPPDYLQFSDSVTDRAMAPIAARLHIPRADSTAVMLCPWSTTLGVHGYVVDLRADSTGGGAAQGRFEIRCATPERRGMGNGRGFSTGGRASLRLQNGHWVIIGTGVGWVT